MQLSYVGRGAGEIGKWLAINGEAIFGTVPWVLAGDGPTKTDGAGFNENNEARFTCREGNCET